MQFQKQQQQQNKLTILFQSLKACKQLLWSLSVVLAASYLLHLVQIVAQKFILITAKHYFIRQINLL